MSNHYRIILGFCLVVAWGCWPGENTAKQPQTPLTLAEWKQMKSPQKFQVESLERLKSGNPRLTDPAQWHQFLKDVVIPARKKEGEIRETTS